MVSIIIPVYNRADLLKECLLSIIAQDYNAWEALVVDDGSTDGSRMLVASLSENDSRISWIERTRLPKGASTCRNIGIEMAAGEYIIFLDSDDLLASFCLKQRIENMKENPDLDFAVFPMEFFKKHPGDTNKLWNIENDDSHLKRFLQLDSVWQTTGPIWKKEALQKIGGFNENLKCWQDVDIALKALFINLKYKTFYNLQPDSYYRVHNSGTISQSNLNSMDKLISREELFMWANSQLNDFEQLAKPMALNIATSALKSLNINFAINFLAKANQKFSIKELLLIWAYWLVFLFRFYKIRPLATSLDSAFVKSQPKIYVGQHSR